MQLTDNRSTIQEIHKYKCSSNIVTKDRLKTITRSDFLTNILCNETDTN